MSDDEIRAAVDLLKSLGVQNLCVNVDTSINNGYEHDVLSSLPSCHANENAHYFTAGSHIATNVIGALCMVLLVALMSGLFLGLLTLEVLDLQIILRTSADEDEIRYASNILPVVRDRHRLLVTLMTVDALAYETLPLFLDNLVPSWVAVLFSTTLILIFGEILPAGIFMGPNQLYLGNLFLPPARFFLWLLYPVAVPLARWLDLLTDTSLDSEQHDDEYNREELSALVEIQHQRRMKLKTRKDVMLSTYKDHVVNGTGNNNNINNAWTGTMKTADVKESTDEASVEALDMPLHQREVDMVQGALKMKTQSASDVYTPYRSVYAVPDNLVLTKANITEIYSHGFSRVPVYRCNKADPDDKTAVLGFLITRQLMLIDWDHERVLSTLPLKRPVCVSPKTDLVDLFENLQTNGLLLTFVCASPLLANKALQQNQPIPKTSGLMGIVTLVDVMESILQDRIYDEGDILDRDQAVAILQRWANKKLRNFIRTSVYKLKRQRSLNLNTNETTPLLPASWRGGTGSDEGAQYTMP